MKWENQRKTFLHKEDDVSAINRSKQQFFFSLKDASSAKKNTQSSEKMVGASNSLQRLNITEHPGTPTRTKKFKEIYIFFSTEKKAKHGG